MQVKLGEKIRELRRRDNKTQEDLAAAVGVSSQAVSRWEKNLGFPDITLIPTIANFFHVTIDELFGYECDRAEKIQKIIDEAYKLRQEDDKYEESVAMLREANLEFPNEPMLLYNLAVAIDYLRTAKFGTAAYSDDEYVSFVHPNNFDNECYRESLAIFEKLLGMELPDDYHQSVIFYLIELYSISGNFEKAEEIAKKQPSIWDSKEYYLCQATERETQEKYIGEGLIQGLRFTYNMLEKAIRCKSSLPFSALAKEKYIAMTSLYEALFENDDLGYLLCDLHEMYLYAANIASKEGDITEALRFFDKAFECYKKYMMSEENRDDVHTSALFSKVPMFMEGWDGGTSWWYMIFIDSKLLEIVESDPKYSEIFPLKLKAVN